MSDKMSGKGLVPSGNTGPVLHGREGNKLIRRAASDALVPIQTMMNQRTTTLHRVGTREFHDEDFRQLQVWAAELGMEGRISEFVEAVDKAFMDLVNRASWSVPKYIEDKVRDWCSDGRIRFFAEFGEGQLSSPRLSKLTDLVWGVPTLVPAHLALPLKMLDLSSVPALTRLWCYNNQLTELDLSSLPALTRLLCYNNRLTELDLSSVPALTALLCNNNPLTELDLSSVPALTGLSCGNNQLTELDLSSVPALRELWCDNNQLTELDLSSVPELEYLSCDNNRLTELDIRSCIHLKYVTVDPWVVVHKRPDQAVQHNK
jgi:hypothetical protein